MNAMNTNSSPRTGEDAHTPTPWQSTGCSISSFNRTGVATAGFNTGPGQGARDAAFIVRACNSHAALVEALEEIETICTESAAANRKRMGTRVGNVLTTARAALDAARNR